MNAFTCATPTLQRKIAHYHFVFLIQWSGWYAFLSWSAMSVLFMCWLYSSIKFNCMWLIILLQPAVDNHTWKKHGIRIQATLNKFPRNFSGKWIFSVKFHHQPFNCTNLGTQDCPAWLRIALHGFSSPRMAPHCPTRIPHGTPIDRSSIAPLTIRNLLAIVWWWNHRHFCLAVARHLCVWGDGSVSLASRHSASSRIAKITRESANRRAHFKISEIKKVRKIIANLSKKVQSWKSGFFLPLLFHPLYLPTHSRYQMNRLVVIDRCRYHVGCVDWGFESAAFIVPFNCSAFVAFFTSSCFIDGGNPCPNVCITPCAKSFTLN